ncbi:hypothetical protein X777_03121 [Ooceraea biroi]|uniref:Uncharacterized protein n=1 Tax=Ooceraea biroi TaxID=2015173 RepID=A0A026WKD9_OOCBI|nr:hypothetical protein X777_03121 [Ooceraea biroi]
MIAELTPEQQKILIDIRRKKTELLLEIQVSLVAPGRNLIFFHVDQLSVRRLLLLAKA